MRFGINHIAAPGLPLDRLFAMARSLGVTEVEIRNDLPGAPIADGTSPQAVRQAAAQAGVAILTINALYPFNVWSPELERKAVGLADYARACGAGALVMCPLNEGRPVAFADTVAALERIAPILEERGLTGLVEPLGFPVSSLRTKAEAIRAIGEAGGAQTFRLVHDTFHHHLAGEAEFYPQQTALVHISGVADPGVAVEDMLDGHRVLVGADDRLDNLGQIRRLLAAGFAGPFSFEPFSPAIQQLSDPEAALRESMAYIRNHV